MQDAAQDKDKDPLVEENRLLSIRLNLSKAFVHLLHKAYDALLHHSVNYRSLPAYANTSTLDLALADGATVEMGQSAVLTYLERVESDLDAAIRRKGMKQV